MTSGSFLTPVGALTKFASANRLTLTVCQRINIHYGSETQGRMVELRRKGCTFRIMAGKTMVEVEMNLSGKSLTTLFLCLNRPHYFCPVPVALKQTYGTTTLRVFKGQRESAVEVRRWLSRKANVNHLDTFSLSSEESLFVMPGGLLLNILPTKDIGAAVEALLGLSKLLPRESRVPSKGAYVIDGLLLDPRRLPATLRPLVPLLRRWAIGDDGIRSEKLAAASPRLRKALADKVNPLLGAVNRYLNAYPQRDETVLLTRLAETALS